MADTEGCVRIKALSKFCAITTVPAPACFVKFGRNSVFAIEGGKGTITRGTAKILIRHDKARFATHSLSTYTSRPSPSRGTTHPRSASNIMEPTRFIKFVRKKQERFPSKSKSNKDRKVYSKRRLGPRPAFTTDPPPRQRRLPSKTRTAVAWAGGRGTITKQ